MYFSGSSPKLRLRKGEVRRAEAHDEVVRLEEAPQEVAVDALQVRKAHVLADPKAFDLMCRLIYYVNIILAFIYWRFDDRLEPLAWVCIGSMSVLIIAMIAQTAYINILDKYGSDGKPRKTRKIRIRKMSAVIRGGCLTAAILGGAITFYQSIYNGLYNYYSIFLIPTNKMD